MRECTIIFIALKKLNKVTVYTIIRNKIQNRRGSEGRMNRK